MIEDVSSLQQALTGYRVHFPMSVQSCLTTLARLTTTQAECLLVNQRLQASAQVRNSNGAALAAPNPAEPHRQLQHHPRA